MSRITSSANPAIKQARKLRERKERQESGLFFAEGLHIVIEAVHQKAPLKSLIYAPELLTSALGQKVIDSCRKNGLDLLEVSAPVFKSLALKDDPQGIAAVIAQEWSSLDSIQVQPGEVWVGLDAVADPGNLGTILRANDAAGGKGVILLDQTTDPYDPTAIRASMGAIFSQKLVKTSFSQFVAWKSSRGVPVIGTSGAAADDYHAFRYPPGLVLLMGSERQGLQERHLEACDGMVSIPMAGRSDSLNLAVATAVVLYEIFNQRRESARERKA